MKKKLLFLFVLTLCLVSLTLAACGEPTAEKKRTEYVLDVRLEGQELICSQSTTFHNDVSDSLDGVVFAVYPYAYTQGAEHKAYVGELSRYAAFDMTDVAVNGQKVEPTVSGAYMTVPATLQRGESAVITMSYTVVIPSCDLRFGEKDGYYNLSGFYPQVSVYGQEGFRTDPFSTVGDPIFSEVVDMTLRLDVPESLVAAVPFEKTESVEEGRKIISASCKKIRDLAVVLKEGYKEYCAACGDVEIRYYSLSDDAQSRCDLASDVLSKFSKEFVSYPYSTFTVAETPFDADGMEFSGMVYIATDATDFDRTIIHETAHQWFYNLVGNDNINAPYLDEGLTTFATEYYYLVSGQEDKFEEGIDGIRKTYARYERLQKMRGEKGDLDMTGSIYQYTDYRYAMLVYDKSALLFDALYRIGGREKFSSSIKIYCNNNAFSFAEVEDLIAAFNAGMKTDVTGLVRGFSTDGATVTAFVA